MKRIGTKINKYKFVDEEEIVEVNSSNQKANSSMPPYEQPNKTSVTVDNKAAKSLPSMPGLPSADSVAKKENPVNNVEVVKKPKSQLDSFKNIQKGKTKVKSDSVPDKKEKKSNDGFKLPNLD